MDEIGLLVVLVVVVGFIVLALSGGQNEHGRKKKRHGKQPAVYPGPDKDTVFVHYPGAPYAVPMKRSDAIAAGLIKPEPPKKRNFWKVYS